jgi:hypothetical protein
MHIISLVRGISMGFILGILVAPDSGAATRRKFVRYASAIGDDIEGAFKDITSGFFEKGEEVESKAEEIMDRNEPGYSNLTGYAGTL